MMKRLRIYLLFICGMTLLSCYGQHVTYRSFKHYNEMVLQYESMPMPDSTQIVMLGNSLTEFGEDWNSYFEGVSCIVNRGIAGDDAKGIKNRLCQICPTQPKAIFFECGANDLSHGLRAHQVVRDLTRTIETIRKQAPHSRLYIQSMLPINEDFGRWKTLSGKTNVIPVINRMLKNYCEKNGFTFIPLFEQFKYPQNNKMRRELCKDGLHLTDEGYAVWAKTIAPYILENVPKSE